MGKKKTFAVILCVLVLTFSVVGVVLPALGNGSVEPSVVEITLYPGGSYEVEKEVINPSIPPKLDLLLLEDETGSFGDDIALMKGLLPDYSDGLAAAMWNGITAGSIDYQAAVAGFRDFEPSPWGNTGDWVYRLLQDMTSDESEWLSGIGALTAGGGNDWPEAQLAALKSGADGHAWDSNQDGDTDDSIDTPEGQDPTWRDDATKVIVLVTDADYHVNGDTGGWLGPTYDDTISELTDDGIYVIILTTEYHLDDYEDLAEDTGGSVKEISDDSSDIVDAIMEGLEEILTDVWWTVECDPGITVDLDPDVEYGVLGGSTLSFTETIVVDENALPGTYHCTVSFYANSYPDGGAVFAEQEVYVEVPQLIDIKPGSYPNSINTKSKGVIPVAILGSENFDVSDVNVETIEFAGAKPVHVAMEYVNEDVYMDIITHFKTSDTNIEPDYTVACLTGKLLDNTPFAGCDTVLVRK